MEPNPFRIVQYNNPKKTLKTPLEKRYLVTKKANGKRKQSYAKILEMEHKNLLIPEKTFNTVLILSKRKTKIPVSRITKQPIRVIPKDK